MVNPPDNPKTQYKWWKESGNTTLRTSFNFKYEINSVNVEDEGIYKCQATNNLLALGKLRQ